jgi:hypothetical protein
VINEQRIYHKEFVGSNAQATCSKSMKTYRLVLFLLVSQTCLAQIKVTKLDKNSIPKAIQYNGHIVDAVRWTDNLGDHIVITTETGKTKSKSTSDDDYSDAALYAYHYSIKEDSIKLTWKVYDYVKECDFDLKANFIKNTFPVTDIDKNGKAEVWLIYETLCTGDVSPSEMKIIMYEDGKKYAVRGKRKTKVSATEYAGGEYSFDDAFKKAPEVFRRYASQLWKKNIMQTWE